VVSFWVCSRLSFGFIKGLLRLVQGLCNVGSGFT